MEASILKSVKNILGLAEDYTAFDEVVIIHINAAFSTLTQLGVGPVDGFEIEDDGAEWTDFVDVPLVQLSPVKSYLYLRVRMLFDPPSTSFHIEAMKDQIKELEWRLTTYRDWLLDPVDPMEV